MQVAVIGLGAFGSAMADVLIDGGNEVIVVDTDDARVQRFAGRASEPMVGDATNDALLRAVGPEHLDSVVVAIGDDVEASVLTCMALLDLGVRHLVAKAEDDKHAKILERIGVHRVVLPERDSALHVAELLMHPRLKEKINLSDSHAILELAAPSEFIGRTPKTLNLRERYRTLILALRRPRTSGLIPGATEFIAPPDPDDPVRAGDILILLVPSERVAAIEALR